MLGWLLGLALFLAVVDWVAVGQRRKRLEYIAKPGTMLALLAWLTPFTPENLSLAWFELGLILSLAGDVLLMLPQQRFIGGLVAFLLAHVAYIVSLNLTSLPPFGGLSFMLALVVIGLAGWLYRRLVVHVPRPLKLPVIAYLLVISGMLLSAGLTLTRPDWAVGPAALVTVGAALFFLSDSVLAWDRFVAPVRYGRVLVMVTYHLGQFGIALGAVWRFYP
jgi:uncharacterized membrane protein YhhN